MASSSGARWRLACDACEAGAWVGPGASGHDVWCESCQASARLPAAPSGQRCERCSAPFSAAPRFVELWGELQHLDAVLGAWAGDIAPLAALLPERPRFLTDLEPPVAVAGDPASRTALMEAVLHGDYRGALASAADDPDPRACAARAIAHERAHAHDAAITEWGRVLEAGEDARARLARGSLLARAGRLEAAALDLALAGDSFESRWNRAAVILQRAVSDLARPPDLAAVVRAREEVTEASEYWSDPTVGRLLWTLLVERELKLREARGGTPPDDQAFASLRSAGEASLRSARDEFEHSTFWDRAMQLLGWARLHATEEAARVAAPLARELAAALLVEPALSGAPLLAVTQSLAAARTAMDLGDPVEARHDIHEALMRDDLRRFRIPCAACGRGTIGIEETAELPETQVDAAGGAGDRDR